MSSLSSLEETNSHISLNSISSDDDDNNTNSKTNQKKKTLGRVKIDMAYIDNKIRRYTTFSKRKAGIMKKAYELATLTGTEVMLLVASETGHVYTFATDKLKPIITSETGKELIETCLAKDTIRTSINNDEKKRIHFSDDEDTLPPSKHIKTNSSDGSPEVSIPLSSLISNSNPLQQSTNDSLSFTIDLKTNELTSSSDTPIVLTLNNFPLSNIK